MTRNAETPDTSAAGLRSGADDASAKGSARSGPVAELGLVAAGLGLVICLISFVTDLGASTSLVLPLLLGGGLLAGTVALPTVGDRVLAPAAVVTITGALLLLRTVAVDGGGALVVGALVLGLLEAGAAAGATLMQAGVLRSRPPRPRRSSASTAFSGQPAGPPYPGPQYPGQQYPGQPYPGGAYPAGGPAAEPYQGDQWTGEHAYAQNARYGGQYGVPGYPPPPPVGAPGYHPAEAPTVAVGAEPPGDTASPPRGTPGTEPGADPLGSGYRSPTESGTGSHRAVSDPGASAFRTEAPTATGSHRVSGTGSYPPAAETSPGSGTGSHRAVPSGTGSYPLVAETSGSGTGSYRRGSADRRPDDDGEHTRTLPTVPDDQR